MRKIILLVMVAISTATCMKAQNGYDNTKHEIAISLGGWSNSQIIDAFEELTGTMFGASFKNEKFTGPISTEYFYHAKPWLGVGGILAYGHNKQDVFIGQVQEGVSKNSYITLMPAVKFDWLRKSHFGLYSKLALGATLRNEKYDSDRNAANSYSDNEVNINWQVSLLGIEAGSQVVRGFLELGTGEQGIALIGLRYKF